MSKGKPIYILGISGGFREGNYDTSAVLLKNGEIIAGVEEERLSRIKHAPGTFPKRSIMYCLEEVGITIQKVDYIAFHMNTYKNIVRDINNYMNFHFGYCPKVKCVDHHTAHAASAYFLSGFEEANIITMDFTGDKVSTTLNYAEGDNIFRIKEYRTPNSLGIFYAIITQFLGFRLLSHEYKVMGLSAYGEKDPDLEAKFNQILRVGNKTYTFNKKMFNRTNSLQQNLYSQELLKLLGKNRKSYENISRREMNIAYAAQKQFEKACVALLKDIHSYHSSKNLCLAGGSTLNCVMNAVLLNTEYVEHIYIPCGAGDAGTSLGAAFIVANELGFKIKNTQNHFIGPGFSNAQIKHDLDMLKLSYRYLEEEETVELHNNSNHQRENSWVVSGKIGVWRTGTWQSFNPCRSKRSSYAG
jgi:carbamoyltransferase